MSRLTPDGARHRRGLPGFAFAAGAVAILLLIAVPLLLTRGGDETPVAETTMPTPTETTFPEATTTPPTDETTVPEATTIPETATTTPATSEAPSTTTTAPPSFDLGESDWVRTSLADGLLVTSAGDEIPATIPLQGSKSVAWDTVGGIVLVQEDGSLRWIRGHTAFILPKIELPTHEDVVIPLEWTEQQIPVLYDVVALDDGPAAALWTPVHGLRWIDLATGEQVAGDPSRVDHFEDTGVTLGAQGRRVWLFYPENADAERGEVGELIWPFDLPQLVVTDRGGEELARITVGSEEEPWVILHDFDGRRVVVSTEPQEPALGPRTVHIIDLECAECTESFSVGPDSMDLVGVLQSEGPVIASSRGA